MKKVLTTILGIMMFAYSYAQILPAEYQTDWSMVNTNTYGITQSYDSVNILDFGGNNTGIISNNTALTSAINALASSANLKVIYFPVGTYLFDATVNLTDNIVLQGAGADQTSLRFNFNGAGADLIRATGTMGIDSTSFIGSGIKNTNKIRVFDPSKFSVGDYIRIIETDDDLMFSTWAYGTLGQFAQITSIDMDSLSLSSPLRITYPESRNPYIQEVNFVENVGISCMKIVRADAATTSGQYRNIRFNYTANSWISGVHSDSTYFAHIDFLNSYKNTLTQSFLENAYEYGGGGRGYGIVCQSSSSECLIINNVFKKLRHSMLLQSGANGNVLSYNYSFEPFWIQGFFPNDVAGDAVLHGNYPFSNLFEHNVVQNIVVDNSHAENGPHNLFFRNQANNSGIFMNTGAGDSTAFIGNEVTEPPSLFYGLYVLTGNGNFTYGNNVNGTNQPSGTSTLNDNSYYLSSAPDFYSGNWPSIGYPNMINSGTIPAETRYNSNIFTLCDTLKPFVPLSTNDLNLFGVKEDHKVNLHWKKLSEYPINQFDILKSYDGIRFSKIDQVLTDIEEKTFDWIDFDHSNETLYYQIVGKSQNEICCSSNVVMIKPNTIKQDQLILYPNPASDKLNIQYYAEQNDVLFIQIIDLQGRVILKETKEVVYGWNDWSINLKNTPSNLYYFSLKSLEQNFNIKLIKE